MKAYYAVVYLKNGDACVSSACMSEEECISELKKVCAREFDKIEATTYMVRELQGDGKFIFGHPRSRDLMQNKKFIKEITQ